MTLQAHWKFGQTFGAAPVYTDLSGNGKTLTVTSTPDSIPDLLHGYRAIQGGRLDLSSALSASLRLLGEVTAVCRVWFGTSADSAVLYAAHTSGETPPDNITWSLTKNSANNITCTWEHGSGINDSVASSFTVPLGEWIGVSIRRNSLGKTVKFDMIRRDVNGDALFSTSSATEADAPTDGSTANVRLMQSNTGSSPLNPGGLGELKVWNNELTDQDVTDELEAILPIIFNDTTLPVITLVSPPDESEIRRNTPLVVRATDETGLRLYEGFVEYDTGLYEIMYDGFKFSDAFVQSSSITPITDGFEFTFVRQNGWPAPFRWVVRAVDTSGNLDG